MGQRALDEVEVVSAVRGSHLRRTEFYSGGDISSHATSEIFGCRTGQ